MPGASLSNTTQHKHCTTRNAMKNRTARTLQCALRDGNISPRQIHYNVYLEAVISGLPKKENTICTTTSTSVPSLLQQFKEVAVPTAQEQEIDPRLPRKTKRRANFYIPAHPNWHRARKPQSLRSTAPCVYIITDRLITYYQ